jgi:nicotinamidase-related amidase
MKWRGLVVVLIDMQEKFTLSLGPADKERIVAHQISVLQQCQRKTIPVIVLEYANSGATIGELEAELGKLGPESVVRLTKNRDSGFCNPALEKTLNDMCARTLFLMGINADCCVRDTALDAIRLGYTILTSNSVIASAWVQTEKWSPWYLANGMLVERTKSASVPFRGLVAAAT